MLPWRDPFFYRLIADMPERPCVDGRYRLPDKPGMGHDLRRGLPGVRAEDSVNPHDGDRAGTTDTTIVANGISHRVRIDGDSGPWVVFSNSLGTTLEMWDAQVLALPGHRVLRYDTRGHGGTAAPPGPYTLEELADDLIGILDGVGVDECAFVGLSLGGMIGQVAMLKAPHRFRCAVLADTTSRYGPEAAERFNTRIETALHSGLGPIADTIPASWFTADFPSRGSRTRWPGSKRCSPATTPKATRDVVRRSPLSTSPTGSRNSPSPSG